MLRGLTSDYVARALGCSGAWVRRMETGRAAVPAGTARRLAELLRVPVEVVTGDAALVATSREGAWVLAASGSGGGAVVSGSRGGAWPAYGTRIPDDVIDDGADAWPGDLAREVLHAAEVTPSHLAALIASVSEEEWCATWLMGCEERALEGWPGVVAVHGDPDVVAAFARLQGEIPGWVAWRDDSSGGGVYYVERGEVASP